MDALPDIIGVELVGQRQPGITATDIVLALTEFLRKNVWLVLIWNSSVKAQTACQSVTCHDFQYDPELHVLYRSNTIDYLTLTGRESEQVKLVETYAKEIGCGHQK